MQVRRAHDAGQQAYAARFRAYGAFADIERRIPELYDTHADGTIREARMDLTLHFPACPDRILVDFTIHVAPPPIPGSEHDIRPGEAARGGESAKRSRYGGRVLTLSIETAGRMEPESRANITALAGYARSMGVT